MFADPQSVTVNSVAQSMPRVSQVSSGNTVTSVYSKADGTFTLTISHTTKGERTRSMVRIDQKAIVTNPLDSTNDYDTLSWYFVCDRPAFGFTSTQVDQLVAGLKTWLDSTAIGKIFGKES